MMFRRRKRTIPIEAMPGALLIKMPPELRTKFKVLCATKKTSMGAVLRQYIEGLVNRNIDTQNQENEP